MSRVNAAIFVLLLLGQAFAVYLNVALWREKSAGEHAVSLSFLAVGVAFMVVFFSRARRES